MEKNSNSKKITLTCMLVAATILYGDVALAADIKALGTDMKLGLKWITDFLSGEVANTISIVSFIGGALLLSQGFSTQKIVGTCSGVMIPQLISHVVK